MSNAAGNKLPEKKKNDLLKKFLNAQEYTKTLKVFFLVYKNKKSAMNVIEDSSYGGYSYDQMQSYPQIPQSAKLPSTKQVSYRDRMFSNDLIYSVQSMNIVQSRDLTSKPKIKKSHHGYNNMTQSSNQIPYVKSKKSSYSQIDKSQSIPRTITVDNPIPIKIKDYDILSMNKQKYTSQAMHESLGAMKTDSFFKPKTKKSFNYSNLHEYESQKLSAEDQHSFQKLRKTSKQQQKPFYTPLQNKQQSPYSLSCSNFVKLINKVQQLQSVIYMYQQAIQMLKKKILALETQNKTNKMSQIYIGSLKQDLLSEKNKNTQLRQKINLQQSYLKQYQQSIISTVQKVDSFYQAQISKITILQKQNQFLKFMLRLELQNQDPNILQNLEIESYKNSTQQKQQTVKSKIEITNNLRNFKQKFSNLLQKNKTKKV